MLIDTITNIRRELKFFEQVAAKYGLQLEPTDADGVSEGVQRYRDLFFRTAEGIERQEKSMLEGLVVLWGTEKCYLEAWRYAASLFEDGADDGIRDEDGGALRKEFIPNWTSGEFAAFVERIGWFVDVLWRGDVAYVGRDAARDGNVGKPGPALERVLEGTLEGAVGH